MQMTCRSTLHSMEPYAGGTVSCLNLICAINAKGPTLVLGNISCAGCRLPQKRSFAQALATASQAWQRHSAGAALAKDDPPVPSAGRHADGDGAARAGAHAAPLASPVVRTIANLVQGRLVKRYKRFLADVLVRTARQRCAQFPIG